MTENELIRKASLACKLELLQSLLSDQPSMAWELTIRNYMVAVVEWYDEYLTGRKAPCAKPEPVVCDDPLAAPSGTGENTARIHVRFTSFRRRLISDRTNLEAGIKYFEDCLVYAGLISSDAESEITRTVHQVKVATKAEEKTEIEVTPL